MNAEQIRQDAMADLLDGGFKIDLGSFVGSHRQVVTVKSPKTQEDSYDIKPVLRPLADTPGRSMRDHCNAMHELQTKFCPENETIDFYSPTKARRQPRVNAFKFLARIAQNSENEE